MSGDSRIYSHFVAPENIGRAGAERETEETSSADSESAHPPARLEWIIDTERRFR